VKYYTNKARQAGMTLIELTVVLLVLIGLAGLLIPYVSGFVTKTHDSTGSSNIAAVNNAMMRFTVENYDKFPNKLDSLVDQDNVVFKKMMSSMMGNPQYFKTTTLTADQATSLTGAGVSTVMIMDKAATNATFDNTDGTKGVATGATFAIIDDSVISESDLSQRMGKPIDMASNDYFVFGLGDDSLIAGKTLNDVPVHFAKSANMGADNAYNHFVVMFEVPNASYCDDSGLAYSQTPGDDTGVDGTGAAIVATAGIQSTDFTYADLTAAQAAFDSATFADKTACEAFNATKVGDATWDNDAGATADVSQNEVETVSGVVWVAATTTAKYMGAAMAMGRGNFEGIGGAISGYYENTAN